MMRPITQLMLAIAALVVAGIAYGVWYGIVVSASTQDASLDAQIASQSSAAARAAAAQHTLATLAPQEAAITTRFVSTADVVAFLENLQSSASAVGATATVGSVSEADAPQPHLVLVMAIRGSFDSVMRALGVIEYGPYAIQTTQASLISNADAAGTWTANITLSVGTKKGGGRSITPAAPSLPVVPPTSTTTTTAASVSSTTPHLAS